MKIILKFKKRCWPEGLAGVIMAGAGNSRVASASASGATAEDELLIPEIWFNDLKTHPRYVQGYIEDETECYCTAFLTSVYADRVREYADQQAEGGDGSWNTHDVMYGCVLLQLEEVCQCGLSLSLSLSLTRTNSFFLYSLGLCSPTARAHVARGTADCRETHVVLCWRQKRRLPDTA